jgi:hypothetical protein
MDKIAAYEMVLADHPLWEKNAGMEGLGIKELTATAKKAVKDMPRVRERPPAQLPNGKLRIGGDVRSVLSAMGFDDIVHEFKKTSSAPSTFGVYEMLLENHHLWAEKAASGTSGHHPAGYEERVMKRYGKSLGAFRKQWKAGKKVPIDIAEALDIESQSARTQRSVPAYRSGRQRV